MVLSEVFKLVFPLVPELGETVQEDDERSFSGGHIMKSHAVHFGVLIFEHRRFHFLVGGGEAEHARHYDQRCFSDCGHDRKVKLCPVVLSTAATSKEPGRSSRPLTQPWSELSVTLARPLAKERVSETPRRDRQPVRDSRTSSRC